MRTFIENEFIKVRSERFTLVVLLLSLIPFIMNLTNYLLNDKNISLDSGFYFRFYNQYFMLIPIVIGIIGCSIFYIEFKNHTILNWLSYSKSTYKLYFSKIFVSVAYCSVIYAVNLSLIIVFYFIFDTNIKNLYLILVSFSLLHFFLILFMLPLAITIVILFRNNIISIVVSIGISMFSMILIAAPFAYLIPTTLSYRLAISVVDSSMGIDTVSQTIIGISLILISSSILTIIGSKKLKVD
ncbi:TPA: ABC transporter permease [Staphylococcus aureus]|uniref:ABC transporter permease n=1 Tax=Staphylococcus aureus TaxID=1280 RepID=UPI001CC3B880|nr:ABC transporter permease [Staphylococcus aureus]MBZ5292667.1 ABC transporter permease [Staphylococcus aureus]MBZ5295270.1 ABC transporter permease [Staphylococcus aureus]UXT64004.1 ABC transporter permease [Staphylococcus aureus]HDM8570517.1 ABC transporter permease [Staphylococcus aureus]HDM8622214.1 ABC transporter permease [Staphylococcus aureus]